MLKKGRDDFMRLTSHNFMGYSKSIRNASDWEDADILCEGLAPSSKQGRLLSVCSSGDNVLALLTLDPKEIIAAADDKSQLACLELKMAAFRHLDYPALLSFLGVNPALSRISTYRELRKDLSNDAASFWDSKPKAIEKGIIHAGKYEAYLRFLGTRVLPWIHSKSKRENLLIQHSLREQKEFYNEEWDTWLWRNFFNFFFGKRFMGTSYKSYTLSGPREVTVGESLLNRLRHVMTQLPTYSNPYLIYALTGNYRSDVLPHYLRSEFKEAISSRVERIKLFKGPLLEADPGPFDGYNLSTIFENMNSAQYETFYGSLLKKSNVNARVAYWDLFAEHGIPDSFKEKVHPLEDISNALHFHDKAWFYQAFHVDEVISS